MATRMVQRPEDMSHDGFMRIAIDFDGDISIMLWGTDELGNPQRVSVEFCTCGAGGGKSPNTIKALRELMIAMELDNTKHPTERGKQWD